MSRQCSFCKHLERGNLERALIEGKISQVEIAKILGISQSNVSRHLERHVKKEVVAAIRQDQSLAEGLNVTAQLKEINREARAILDDKR